MEIKKDPASREKADGARGKIGEKMQDHSSIKPGGLQLDARWGTGKFCCGPADPWERDRLARNARRRRR